MVDFVQSIIDRVWLRLANLIEKNQFKAIASIRVIGNDGDTNGVQLTTTSMYIFVEYLSAISILFRISSV